MFRLSLRVINARALLALPLLAVLCGLPACGTAGDTQFDARGDAQLPVPTADAGPPDPASEATIPPTPEPERMTIYLASSNGSDCERYNVAGCQIDALDWNLATGKLKSVKTVVDTNGAFSPSVNPDGSHISFDATTGGSKLTLTVRSLINIAEADVVVTQGADKSNWRNNEELFFGLTSLENSKEDRWADLGHATVGGSPFAVQGNIDRYLGAVNPLNAFDTSDCSGEDPYIHPLKSNIVALHTAPYWAEIERNGAHTCPWMSDVPNTDHKNPQPVVIDLNAKEWIEGQTFWRFKLTWDTEFPGCAHPAFSPDGSRILCTDQPTFYYEDHTPATGQTYPIGFNRIYGFELQTNAMGVEEYLSVRGEDALFKHTHPAALKDIDQIWTTPHQCSVYYTKRADFCGSKTRIVANTYCVDQQDKSNLKTVFSRVMLIDFTDAEQPIYTDLTSQLEDQRGLPRGTMTSFTAACHAPSK